MDNVNQIIDNLREKLKKAKALSVRISDNVARLNNEISTRMASNRTERMECNVKVLEGELEVAISEKLKIEKKLMEVEGQRDDFARELDKLKSKNEKQGTRLGILRQEIESMKEQKREIFAKFKQMKSQETAVGALKKQFQENLCEFLNEDPSTLESMNAEGVPANVSDDFVASQQTVSTDAGSSTDANEQVNVDEPMETISDQNYCQTMESVVRSGTQVVLQRLSMRKVSGTVIEHSRSTNSSTGARVTRTKTIETHEIVEVRRPSTMVTERLSSQAIVERRPRRTLRCTLCSKPYVSRPSQAFCGCQRRMNSLE